MSYTVAMFSVHTSPLDMPGSTKFAGGMNVYIRQLALELAYNRIHVDIFTHCLDERTAKIVYLHPLVRVIHIESGLKQIPDDQDIHQHLSHFSWNVERFRQEEG